MYLETFLELSLGACAFFILRLTKPNSFDLMNRFISY